MQKRTYNCLSLDSLTIQIADTEIWSSFVKYHWDDHDAPLYMKAAIGVPFIFNPETELKKKKKLHKCSLFRLL